MSIGSISAVSLLRMSAGSFSRTAAGNRAYNVNYNVSKESPIESVELVSKGEGEVGELSYTGYLNLFYCEERAVWDMVWKSKGTPLTYLTV